MRKDTIDVIIPIYNEEGCISELIKRLTFLRKKIRRADVRFILVDDGSGDKSLKLLEKYAGRNKHFRIISLSRNFGHQIAVTAGLDYSDADYVAIIDADLQDPPEAIYDMYKKCKEGYDIVYGQRIVRSGETPFKRGTAKIFYRFINKMCDIKIPLDTGDFRVMSKKVVNVLRSMRERRRFIRGMVPWVGFKSYAYKYNRKERYAGKTKYPFRKMFLLAKDAIFSFSDKPLRIASYTGFLVLIFGILSLFVILYLRLFTEYYISGVTAVIVLLIILSGAQIFMIGIMGEYVGRTFEESKKRPLYIVDKTINMRKARGIHEER